jgi:hypothetical protein
MRIRTLKSQLAKGQRFTSWLDGIRVTLRAPNHLEEFAPGYEEQRKIAERAVKVVGSYSCSQSQPKHGNGL